MNSTRGAGALKKRPFQSTLSAGRSESSWSSFTRGFVASPAPWSAWDRARYKTTWTLKARALAIDVTGVRQTDGLAAVAKQAFLETKWLLLGLAEMSE